MVAPRWFEPKITLGGAVQIGLLIITLIGAYYGIISRVSDSERDIADLKAQVSSITNLATRVTVLETNSLTNKANRDKQINDINVRVADNQNAVEVKLEKIVDAVSVLSNQISSLTATIKATSGRP